MLNSDYVPLNTQKHIKKMNLFIIIFLIISNLKLVHCGTTYTGDEEEFDEPFLNPEDIIIFNHTKFNAGSKNKNGDLIIEYYSDENYYDMPASFLFYGLSKNGRYCFSNESSYTQEKDIDIDEVIDIAGYYNNYRIYDSKSLFVSIRNDSNRGKEYLFSINTYNSIVELHDFNNNTYNNRLIWDFDDFFKLNREKYEFPYEINLYELKGESVYIIAFIPKIPFDYCCGDFSNLSFIKKFRFKSFDKDAYKELKSIDFNNYINRTIIGTFFMDDYNRGILVIISFKEIEESFKRFLSSNDYQRLRYTLNFYNENLQPIYMQGYETEIYLTDLFAYSTEYLYFKSIYLKHNCVMFAYITFGYLFFDLYMINLNYGGDKIYPDNNDNLIPIGQINSEEFLSDFIKINNIKLVFVFTFYSFLSTRSIDSFEVISKIAILIIDISPDYSYFEISRHLANLENYIPTMQISAFFHNGFLLLTSTAFLKEEIYNLEDEINYFSMLMIFGYPNGTDCTIDISEIFYINEELDYYPYFFYDFLSANFTIENNIFQYKPDVRIKLVSIPDEILIYERTGIDEKIQLQNNSFIYPDSICIIKQNKSLIKTSKYYYIEYQYMVQEIKFERRLRILKDEEPEIFYGRTNRAQFKLCHEFCETCYELSTSNNEQKCLSCLPEYQYNYFYFMQNNIDKNQLLMCVPEDYFNNEGILTSCAEGSTKYYVNTTDNKKICFKDSYDCPPSYPIYNETSKECFYCDFERFKNGECTAENLTMNSCTRCDYECFIIGGCNFNNFNTTTEDFYERIKNGGYLSNYDGGADLKIKNGDGYAFQITTFGNELNNLKEKKTVIFQLLTLKNVLIY